MINTLRFIPIFLAAACLDAVGPPPPEDPFGRPLPAADLTILWIGNSLTYANELPSLVAELARSEGVSVEYAARVAPDYSLEDHWRTGAETAIRTARARVVILQQGPSSLPASQDHLREWSQRMAAPIRDAGGQPALYMVWPPKSRSFAFADVAHAYTSAAQAVDGWLFPAGEAWQAVWEEDPEVGLYDTDGFHPSRLGTILTALTIYGTLAWDGVSEPACPVRAVGPLAPETATLLCRAARRAITEHARRPG